MSGILGSEADKSPADRIHEACRAACEVCLPCLVVREHPSRRERGAVDGEFISPSAELKATRLFCDPEDIGVVR